MKGVILCGGTGSRLDPLTRVTNKHLLPVNDRPMIYYPLQWMVSSGINEIILVCGGNAPGDFLRIIGNGAEFGVKRLVYTYQREPKGIADALSLAEEWANKEPVCVMLGDNVLEKPCPEAVTNFDNNPTGARIFLAAVDHPERYGVVEVDDNGHVLTIEEKPVTPKSNLIAIGLYLYDATVWDYIRGLTPSKRNELEITDINNRYRAMGKLQSQKVQGFWADCGESLEGYMQSCIAMYQLKSCTIRQS